ncbi:MAG: hypothetical protein AB2L20_23100 [Mangrovibacterium sp.]
MGRQIITEKDLRGFYDLDESIASSKEYAETEEPQEKKDSPVLNVEGKDDYFNRLLKYIPAEIVGLYLTLANITNTQSVAEWISWLVFGVCLTLTPLYLWRVLKVLKSTQIIISTLSFVVWAYALGGPFEQSGLFSNVFAAILLPIYTVLIPIIKPEN